MPRLNYKNNSFALLSAGITNVATSFSVDNGAALPDVPFRATILSEVGNNAVEIIEVQAKNGNTLSSVVRGLEGTTAVAHNAGVRIENRFTANGLTELGNADTVNNHTVESNVPLNALFTDTVYVHPVNHLPSIISQDANNRFVTDTEKTTWNGKENSLGTGTTSQYLRGDKTWTTPPDTTYSEITTAEIDAGTATTLRTITARRLQYAFTNVKAALAAVAEAVAWGNITDKPTTFAPTSHDNTAHSTNYEPEFTKNTAFNKSFGSIVNTVTQGNDSRLSDSRTPTSHEIAGALHSASTLSSLNSKISDATLIDTGDVRLSNSRTPTSHEIAGTLHSSSTLASLNSKISDATLIDTGDTRLSNSRTPTSHAIAGTLHSTSTLSELNSKISDATLIDTGDSRLSDARTPTSHNHTLSEVTDSGNLAAINTNASTSNYLRGDGTWVTPPDNDTTYSVMSVAEGKTGTATSSRVMRADYTKQIVEHYTPEVLGALPTTDLHSGKIVFLEIV